MLYDGEEEYDNMIAHIGVKGMRWGVRRDRKPAVTPSAKSGKRENLSGITNKDLKSRIDRLDMEKRYSTLLKEAKERDRPVMEKGAKVVGEMLAKSGKSALETFATKQFNVMLSNGQLKVAAKVADRAARRAVG